MLLLHDLDNKMCQSGVVGFIIYDGVVHYQSNIIPVGSVAEVADSKSSLRPFLLPMSLQKRNQTTKTENMGLLLMRW